VVLGDLPASGAGESTHVFEDPASGNGLRAWRQRGVRQSLLKLLRAAVEVLCAEVPILDTVGRPLALDTS
jgi:hypothetical protein